MERITKHRVLGIFVVIALVIISLPFFRNSKEITAPIAAVKAPSFPEQTVQAPTTSPVIAVGQPIQSTPIKQNVDSTRESAVSDQPDDVISVTHPSMVNTQENAIPKSSPLPAATTPSISPAEPIVTPVISTQADTTKTTNNHHLAPKKVLAQTSHVRTSNAKLATADNHPPLGDNGLVSLKNAAYVIQIGSFKNKLNALKLVNQLRANGYPAFIQKISTTFGENTRVFVGPENKRTSASALAERLESDMHLRGIVISYQPLTL